MTASPLRVEIGHHAPPVEQRRTAALLGKVELALGERLGVAAVTVQEHEVTEALIVEVLAKLLHHGKVELVAQVERAGELDETRRGTKGQDRRDEKARQVLLDELGELLRGKRVGAERVVLAVLLSGAEEHEHGVVTFKVSLYLRVCATFKTHGDLPFK